MIEAKLSHINDGEDWFPSIKQIATCLNALKNKSSNIYVNALDLISGVNRDLLNAANRNYESYQEVEHSINSKITNFELFIDGGTNLITEMPEELKEAQEDESMLTDVI